jgi:hypothetical protein
MDHVEIEIGLGRFEAFTIIGARHDSSLHAPRWAGSTAGSSPR